jgi:hypothetical protein
MFQRRSWIIQFNQIELSKKLYVISYQLATVNSGTIDAACDNLSVGMVSCVTPRCCQHPFTDLDLCYQSICLGLAGQDCSSTHVMVYGETCDQIASDAGTTLALLLENNPNVNSACTNIYPEEVRD